MKPLFDPFKKINTGGSWTPSAGTHAASSTPLCFPSIFAGTWRNFHRNVSNNFHSLIGFLRLNWNIISLCSFSQILSFVTYGVFMIATCDSIFTTQTNHHCLLSKRTLDKQLLFCNGRRHSSFWFPHIFGEH